MTNLQNLWYRLTTPHATDDDARREYMTRVIFVILVAVGAIFLVVFFIGWLMGTIPILSLAVTVGMEVFLVAGWWLSDRGYWQYTRYVPPVLFYLLALQVNIQEGLGTIAMLQYTIAVLLAIILVGGVVQWIMLGLCIATYLSVGWMYIQQNFSLSSTYPAFAIPVSGMLIFIALVQWFYARQYQRTMAEARMYADALAAHQATLEKTVTEQTAELNRLLDSISDAVVSASSDGKVLSWNPAAEELAGWTEEEILGQPISILHAEQDQTVLQEKMTTPSITGKPQAIETILIRKDGTERLVRMAASAMFDDQNNPTGMVSIITDITEQKQMEAEQERLQQELIEAQQQVIQDLSTPVIPVMQGIIVMPLVGNIDSIRAQDITRSLLAGISRHKAKIVIVDVTGVSIMDTGIVNRLNKTIQAAKLKGAQTIVTGISDAVAESIVDLGIDWSDITTLSNLQAGLVKALGNLGIDLKGNSR